MGIYLGDKQGIAYKGDYKPVNLYHGSKKAAGWELSEKTGTELSWDDTYNDKVLSAVVEGKSEQEQTVQGNNLFDKSKITAGYTLSTTNGQAVVAPNNSISPYIYINGQSSAVRTAGTSWFFYDQTKAYLGNNATGIFISGSYYMRFVLINSWDFDTYMCNFGATLLPYAPFVPNSPSSDYPSPITSVGDGSGIDFTVQSKNRFNPMAAYENANTIRPNAVSIMEKDGRTCLYFSLMVSNANMPFLTTFKANTRYAIKYDYYHNGSTGIGQGFQVMYTDGTYGYFQPQAIYNQWATRTVLTAANKTVAKLYWSYVNSLPTFLDLNTIQIEEGTASTSYQPYRGEYTARRDIVLRSLPDGTRDEYDAVTGTVTRRVETAVFDGVSIALNKNDSSDGSYAYYRSFPGGIKALAPGICTHFRQAAFNAGTAGVGTFTCNYWSASSVFFNFYGLVTKDNAGQSNANEANAWLAAQYAAGTPVTVLYQLAEPTIEQIDPLPLPTYPRYTALSCSEQMTAKARVVEK